MTQFAISVSDLHLGRGNLQDDFTADAEFADFCNSIVSFCRDSNHKLSFVLNGDIIDFWEIAPDDELTVDAADLISQRIYYPADTPYERQLALERAEWQINAALDAHPGFIAGLRAITSLNSSVRIHYLVGNHDHAVASSEVQETIREALAVKGIAGARTDQLAFGHSLLIPAVGAYFEHGHQCASDDSSYPDPTNAWEEAPGYFFLRFVWNRLQSIYGYRDTLSDTIKIVLRVAFDRNGQPSRAVLQCLYEYFEACRIELVPRIVDGPAGIIPRLYRTWLDSGAPLEPQRVTNDAVKREISRTKLQPTTEQTKPMSLLDADVTEPPAGLPGRPILLNIEQLRDSRWKGLRARFKSARAPFEKLPEDLRVGFLGHTHRELHMYLRNVSGKPATRYINHGSWTHGASRLGFGWAKEGNNPRHSIGLSLFR